MKQSVFKPKYSPMTWALALLYAAPWLFAVANAAAGRMGADWKLFWLLSGTVWALAGLMHLKDVFLLRVTLGGAIEVEMALRKPASQSAGEPVHICGDVVCFEGQAVPLRYMANGPELMQRLVSAAGKGGLNLVYEDHEGRQPWSEERNLLCLIVFALYMMVMLGFRLRPLHMIGPATDALLLGWAVAFPVLLILKFVRMTRERLQRRSAAEPS